MSDPGPTRLGAFLKKVRYSGHVDPAVLHARITTVPRGAVRELGATAAEVTRALVAALQGVLAQIAALEKVIERQLAAHVDGHIFTSLPRSGTVRAARLLAETGDARARYPTPEALGCAAGVVPSTRQSGKLKVVSFRFAVDKQLRDAVVEFAGDSRLSNPWAADIYRRAVARGHDHPHAVRILARAWIYVIWHCWQDHQPYRPERHRALQRLAQPPATAAS